MRTILMVAALMGGCTSDAKSGNGQCPIVGEYVVEMCGDRPLAPGWAAQVSGDTATMAASTFNDIAAWRENVTTWLNCVGGL